MITFRCWFVTSLRFKVDRNAAFELKLKTSKLSLATKLFNYFYWSLWKNSIRVKNSLQLSTRSVGNFYGKKLEISCDTVASSDEGWWNKNRLSLVSNANPSARPTGSDRTDWRILPCTLCSASSHRVSRIPSEIHSSWKSRQSDRRGTNFARVEQLKDELLYLNTMTI